MMRLQNKKLLHRPRRNLGVRQPGPLIRGVFYAFIFSIPFEAMNLGLEIKNFTISKLVGFVLLGLALVQPRVCFKPPSSAFYYFLIYLLVYGLFASSQGSIFNELVLSYFLSLGQMLVLFLVTQNLMTYEGMAKRALLTLGISCLSLAAVVLLGFMSTEIAQGRITAGKLDANTFGAVLSFGLLALIGLATSHKIMDARIRWFAWLSFSILAVTIVQSGSRGAMIGLVAGLLVLGFKGRRVLKINLKGLVLVFLAIGAVVVFAYNSESVRERWERTLGEGEMAGREKIYEKAADMFIEKPLLGWGPGNHILELGARLGKPKRDPHNLIFWMLLEVGLLGAIPFLGGVWICFREAWKARIGVHGLLPMSMMLLLLIINMKGTYHHGKLFWVVLAYAAASGKLVHFQKLSKQSPRVNVLVPT